MKTENITRGELHYATPEVDKIDVKIEQGFALSTNGSEIPDLTNNNYGEY